MAIEGEDGDSVLVIGAGVGGGPTGMGEGVDAAERDAEFQCGIGPVRDEVGHGGGLNLLDITAARAGSGATGQNQTQTKKDQNSCKTPQMFENVWINSGKFELIRPIP